MKKTLTVNLGGTVFQIDEDAYILLDNYLNNLRFHFRKEAEGEEIVSDMEMRISELFAENMAGGQMVITIDNVEAVIDRMGRPEQWEDEHDESFSEEQHRTAAGEDGSQKTGDGTSESMHTNSQETVKKRLFRDMDNRVLGGVASGIAAYFGWDPTALRLVFIILGLLPGGLSILLIYLVLQFIIPPARTATEKLQMRGEPVNMENIGKTVTDGFERENKMKDTKATRTGLQRFFDGVVSLIGVIIKVFLFFLLICCIPAFFGIVIALFTLLMTSLGIIIHLPEFCCHLFPHIPWGMIGHAPVSGGIFLLCGLLLLGIPLLCILQVIFQSMGYWKPMKPAMKIILLILWLVSLVAGFVLLFNLSTI